MSILNPVIGLGQKRHFDATSTQFYYSAHQVNIFQPGGGVAAGLTLKYQVSGAVFLTVLGTERLTNTGGLPLPDGNFDRRFSLALGSRGQFFKGRVGCFLKFSPVEMFQFRIETQAALADGLALFIVYSNDPNFLFLPTSLFAGPGNDLGVVIFS